MAFERLGGRLPPLLNRWAERSRAWYGRNALWVKINALVLLLAFIYLIPLIFVPIYPGQAGVVWRRFGGGTDTQYVMGEGLRVKLPWDVVYLYDTRMQTESEEFNVISEDGLPMDVELTVRFRPNPRHLGLLHKTIGPDYVQKLLVPEVGAHGRQEMAQVRPEELYTQKRELVQQRILDKLSQSLDVRYLPDSPGESFIYLQDVLIRSIKLPPQVVEAIQNKVVQKHRLLEYDYRLQKEEKEKERKRIEGEGIQMFQNMVSSGISEQFLKWKGINATLELAKSNNSKIVVIGAGEGGLPLILGNLDGQPAPGLAAPPAKPVGEEPLHQENPDHEPEWAMDKP